MRIIIIFFLFVNAVKLIAEEKVGCGYNDNKTFELEHHKFCGVIMEDGLLKVNKEILQKERWSKYGLSCIYVHGKGWFYINQNGEGRNAPFSQGNDCTAFSNGVAVGLSYGKVVFYNQLIEVIKKTDYTYASRFNNGYSKVCTGTLELEYEQDGEHYFRKGGFCGFIDNKFQVVVPLEYNFESTPEPKKF